MAGRAPQGGRLARVLTLLAQAVPGEDTDLFALAMAQLPRAGEHRDRVEAVLDPDP